MEPEAFHARLERALGPRAALLATLFSIACVVGIDLSIARALPGRSHLVHMFFRLLAWALLLALFVVRCVRLHRARPAALVRRPRWNEMRKYVVAVGLGLVVVLEATRFFLRGRVSEWAIGTVHGAILMAVLVPLLFRTARRALDGR